MRTILSRSLVGVSLLASLAIGAALGGERRAPHSPSGLDSTGGVHSGQCRG
jgi:hypothetical protein